MRDIKLNPYKMAEVINELVDIDLQGLGLDITLVKHLDDPILALRVLNYLRAIETHCALIGMFVGRTLTDKERWPNS